MKLDLKIPLELEFVDFIRDRVKDGDSIFRAFIIYVESLEKQLFQPIGASHHDANKCPYCKENLNGRT